MKELSIEQKAQRYDEAIEIAKEINNEHRAQPFNVMTRVFHELKESEVDEEERIKKVISDILLIDSDEIREILEANNLLMQDIDTWLEKQSKQKPADKVEPKFHEGDWVVFNNNHQSVYQIERIDNYRYYLRHYLGGSLSVHFDNELIRAWTIQDARAGDVLEFGDHGRLVSGIVSYVNKTTGKVDVNCLLENNNFKVGNYYNLDTIKPHPATKEQRDTLEKTMNDAGYTFDFEKKELKRIEQKPADVRTTGYWHVEDAEQKPAWSEEDSMHLTNAIYAAEKEWGIESRTSKWLKSLKDRVGCEADCTTTKGWSEEDEAMYQGVIETEQYMLDVVYGRRIFDVGNESIKEECAKELAWLNSRFKKLLK